MRLLCGVSRGGGYIYELTAKMTKTHSGVRAELARLLYRGPTQERL